jgi:AAA family ATP:ADP antiporter
MVMSFFNKYYGDFDREELKKFIFLGAIFAFTIGTYWLLRPLKDGLFITVSGGLNIPAAKIVSLLVVIPLAIMYTAIVDRYPRHKIFYVLCAVYGAMAFVFAYLFNHSVFGLDSKNLVHFIENGKEYSKHVTSFGRILGWAWYSYVESFGSLMAALFWAFAADTTKPESAKRGFGIIAMGAQIGGIIGPLISMMGAQRLGASVLMMIAGIAIFAMGLMIRAFMATIPLKQLEGYKEKKINSKKPKVKTGLFEGLKLLVSQPYLLSIFGIISIFEVINTIFDFKLKMLAGEFYKEAALISFLGKFGVIVNVVALLCLILGISNIGRKLGVKISLLILPALVAVSVVLVYLFGTLLIPVMLINVAVKALNYAFNQPIKEQLYIPTSKDTKYKAKAWMDMFGARGAKATGSSINVLVKVLSINAFLAVSSFLSFGLIGIWLISALYAGNKHKEAIDADEIVC